MKVNQISHQVIGAAIEVHKNLGPGLLESTYHSCLLHELNQKGFYIETEKVLPVVYIELTLQKAYRIDLLIENKLVVELKSVEAITSTHLAQVLTYMKLGEFPHGLLINFNVDQLVKGVKRLIRSEYIDSNNSNSL